MKNFIKFVIFIALLVTLLTGCGQTQISQEKQNKIYYCATDGGYVDGKVVQLASADFFSEMVMAVPYEGYEFVGWDDGKQYCTRADRTDCDLTVTAIFKKKEFYVNYLANIGGKIVGETVQTVKYGENSQSVKAVPAKGYEFIGWSDGVQTAERNDISVRRDLEVRANFAANDTIRFPVLMVFIPEIHAELELIDGTVFNADYVMSQSERKIYDIIPNKISGFLNDIFAGEVVFEIDTFYVQAPLDRSNLYQGTDAWLNYDYGIDIGTITELKGIIEDYRSVITTFGVKDYDSVAIGGSGSAERKFSYVNADIIWGNIYRQNLIPEFLLEFNDNSVYSWWESILLTYIHEFTHSAELYYSYSDVIPLDLHGVVSYYSKQNKGVIDFEPFSHYLLGKALVEGEVIGIPSSFWIEEPKKI